MKGDQAEAHQQKRSVEPPQIHVVVLVLPSIPVLVLVLVLVPVLVLVLVFALVLVVVPVLVCSCSVLGRFMRVLKC